MLAIVLCLTLVYVAVGATEPAQITIQTDGTSAEIWVDGGGVGYPGPNQIEVVHDEHGMVVIARVRFFGVYGEQVYLPWVAK